HAARTIDVASAGEGLDVLAHLARGDEGIRARGGEASERLGAAHGVSRQRGRRRVGPAERRSLRDAEDAVEDTAGLRPPAAPPRRGPESHPPPRSPPSPPTRPP